MMEKITSRILSQLGLPQLLDQLVDGLHNADLQSLLQALFARKAAKISPADLLLNYNHNRFSKPATTDPLDLMAFDLKAFQFCEGQFERLELSPVAPFGACSAIATVHQNKVLSAGRNLEVVSDATNMLALECAVRRLVLLKEQPKNKERIHLCASHRLVRTQPLPDPRFLPHFRIFSLCSAGREEGGCIFETEMLERHLRFYLSFMEGADSLFFFEKIEVLVTVLEEGKMSELIENQVFVPLRRSFPNVRFDFYPERQGGRNYYQNLCFHLNAYNKAGVYFNLADGGLTDWTQKLLNNNKERLFISGIGSEMVVKNFGKG